MAPTPTQISSPGMLEDRQPGDHRGRQGERDGPPTPRRRPGEGRAGDRDNSEYAGGDDRGDRQRPRVRVPLRAGRDQHRRDEGRGAQVGQPDQAAHLRWRVVQRQPPQPGDPGGDDHGGGHARDRPAVAAAEGDQAVEHEPDRAEDRHPDRGPGEHQQSEDGHQHRRPTNAGGRLGDLVPRAVAGRLEPTGVVGGERRQPAEAGAPAGDADRERESTPPTVTHVWMVTGCPDPCCPAGRAGGSRFRCANRAEQLKSRRVWCAGGSHREAVDLDAGLQRGGPARRGAQAGAGRRTTRATSSSSWSTTAARDRTAEILGRAATTTGCGPSTTSATRARARPSGPRSPPPPATTWSSWTPTWSTTRKDIPRLLEPVLDGRATVVYGNRTFGSHSAYSFWYVMGNKGVTLAANMLFNSYIGDLETCFKLMPVELYRSPGRRARAASAWRPRSPASCCAAGSGRTRCRSATRARTREEGKKITWRDGVEALWILGRERLRRRPRT